MHKMVISGSTLKKHINGYLFILPQMILFLLFMVYPVFEGVRLSFLDISFVSQKWVGLNNYIDLFNDPVFVKALINTLQLMFWVTIFTVIIGFTISVAIFDKSGKYISFIRGCYYLPVILSMVVMSIVWLWLLNPAIGLLPYLMEKAGMDRINVMGNEKLVLPLMIFIVWMMQIGQAIILYVAAMIGIPKSFIEAAQIDGASRWNVTQKIMIPLTAPITLYIIVICFINVIRAFAVVHLMTGGGPNYQSTTIMYLCYLEAFKFGDNIGKASAIGVIMFIIVFILSIGQFRLINNDS